MSNNSTVLFQNRLAVLTLPDTNLSLLPTKGSRRLWVGPTEFLLTINAIAAATWALTIYDYWCPALPQRNRRGPK